MRSFSVLSTLLGGLTLSSAATLQGCGDSATTDNGLGGAGATTSGTGSSAGTGSATGTGGGVGVLCATGTSAQTVEAPTEAVSPFIVTDQFGYLPDSEKIAVLRDPDTGFDAGDTYTPGAKYQLIDAATKASVLDLTPTAWNAGAVHVQSGDKAWHLDFSSVTTPGTYYVLDVDNAVRSDLFVIGEQVYGEILRQALRTFFYQRSGFAKDASFAGEAWADGASHLGAGQDKNARLFSDTGNAATERDVSGGWYDAGDLNKYTPWTGDYVVTLLRAYEEAPNAFSDDYNIPESNNGIADILDEARFGLEHLVRLQEADGSLISIIGADHASPPSAATKATIYGPPTTNATIRGAMAYSWGSRHFATIDAAFSEDLKKRAENAWNWVEANPAVEFANTGKVAAGEQQSNAKEVGLFKLGLAVELYRLTGDAKYKTFFETNYAASGLSILSGYNAAWELQFTEFFLDYTKLEDADGTVKAAILTAFNDTMGSSDNFGMLAGAPDPYLAHTSDFTWGSNAHKSRTGDLFYDVISFKTDATKNADARKAAERYVHYLHGVNPLSMVYLSNMGDFGAAKSVTQFYHTWFADKSAKWDEVGVSTYGPAPGFLVGGPNPSYDWDAQCPGNALCPAAQPTPPYGQPAQKSYAQFNDNWPLNSWSVTENSDGYQVAYIRLLSKFVTLSCPKE